MSSGLTKGGSAMPNKQSKGKKQGQEKGAKQTQAVQPILVSEETLIFDPTSSTPFDDVFKTLLYDHTRLVIPLINKAFHENYTPKLPEDGTKIRN